MKKRILSLFMCVCVLVTMLPLSAILAGAQSDILYGDANDDKNVDLQDVLLLEKYVAKEDVTINEINSDVNCDGVVDKEDIRLIREYLVGNLASLTPDLRTLTFDTKGGSAVEDIKVGKGYSVKKEIPSPSKDGYIFTGWEKIDGEKFFQNDAVMADVHLVATYHAIDSNEKLKVDSFALLGQPADLSFRVLGGTTAEQVLSKVKLIPKDGSDTIALEVQSAQDGVFVVGAKTQFTPGASYELTLGEGLNFENKGEEIRVASFSIQKAQQDNLYYNEDLVFIKDTDDIDYQVGADTLDMLEISLFSNGEKDEVSGTFNYPGSALAAGDYVCIYENIDPRHRDYTKNDYENDRLAYIKITAIKGDEISFKSLDADDTTNIIALPDTIPFRVESLPTTNGSVNKNDYDASARATLGFTETPKYNSGDFLVFYTESFASASADTPVCYAQVTGTNGDTVNFKIVTKDAVENYMGIFVSKEVNGNDFAEKIDADFLKNVEEQAVNSGFVNAATEHMLQSALQTDSLKSSLLKNGVTPDEISKLAATGLLSKSGDDKNGLKLKVESVQPKASLITGEDTYFDNGIGIGLDIRVVLSLDKKVSETEQSSLKIDLTASFLQEIAVNVNVNVVDQWDWYLFVPVLSDLSCYTNVDIKSYSFVSISAKLYSVSKALNPGWETVTSKLADPKIQKALTEINKIGVFLKKNKDKIDKIPEYLEKLKALKEKLPKVLIGGEEVEFEEAEKKLGMTDIGSELQEVLDADNVDKSKIGVDKLVDKYTEMLNKESQWITLLEETLFEKEIHIKVVAIKIQVDFIIRANVNISLGAEIEYQTGKRYNFWVHVFERKSGSSEMDLIDERFGFQFYVMGALGLKIGIKAEVAVGVISTKIASVGANIEFGPYLKVYGYFFYTYTKIRPANTGVWEEAQEMLGALYLDFGLYLIVNFKAQAFDDTFVYEPTLFDGEFSLLTVGVQRNVYGFANGPKKKDVLNVIDVDSNFSNGIQMPLPTSYLQMKVLDLVTGVQSRDIYDQGKFFYRFSNRNFTIDKGIISINLPADTRYIESDLIITWKSDKVAFSKYDMSITIPLVWTNLSGSELNEKFVASVAVGNAVEGYNTVWSESYSRKDSFDLPTKEEIIKILSNNSDNPNYIDLKYSDIGGYTDSKVSGINISQNTTFYFDVTYKEYTVNVHGVQKTDGSTESKAFTAKYGEAFKLDDLRSTGTDNQASQKYTSFLNLTQSSDNSSLFSLDTFADSFFFDQFGDTVELNANYTNDALTATYSFIGITAPDFSITFKKGEVPYFEDLNAYIVQHGGEGTTVLNIHPLSAPVEHSIKYTVTCRVVAEDIPEYTLSFETNGGNSIKSQDYAENSKIFQPTSPQRLGYTFEGWYGDVTLTTPFIFNSMPSENTTVYAKWMPNNYKVSFQGISEVIADIIVTYDSAFGELPVPAKETNRKFVGWYTDATGGTLVTSQTVFQQTNNVTLYARWQDKKTISGDAINYATNQTHTYDKNQKAFVFSLSGEFAGLSGFVLQYQRYNTTEEWSNIAPVNAGNYNVKITRPFDDDYLAMPEKIINNVIIINKATPKIKLGQVFALGGVVRCTPPETDSDGDVEYRLVPVGSQYNVYYGNTTGFFDRLEHTNFKYSVIINESTNYKSIHSQEQELNIPGKKAGAYSAELIIRTGTSFFGGTDDNVYGGVALKSLSWRSNPVVLFSGVKWNLLDKPDYNDFEKGDVDTYNVMYNIDPWDLKNAEIEKVDSVPFSDDWHLDWLKVAVRNNNLFFESTTISVNNENFKKQNFPVNDQEAFKRNITDFGDFYNGGGNSLDLRGQTTNYGYSFSGVIKDQFYPEGYNSFEHSHAPEVIVTSNNKAYDRFIKYTGVASFYIDTIGLKNYILENGGQDFKYIVTMKFLPDLFSDLTTVNGISTFTKEISVKVPTAAKRLASAPLITAERSSLSMPMASFQKINTLSDSNPLVLSSEKLFSLKGNMIEVPVFLNGDSDFWGVLASVNYDKRLLELTGYTIGDLFVGANFTLANELSSTPYKFIATADDLSNISGNGVLLKLKFKVKDDAGDQSSLIELDLIQGVNTEGAVLTTNAENNSVIIDSAAPVISGVEDGKTYYGSQTVEVKDENLDKVTLNGQEVALKDGKFELSPAKGSQTIKATDLAGNETVVIVTVLEKSSGGAETGDSSKLVWWIAIAIVCASILPMAIILGKRKKRDN